jgi:cellulose biosynthesis protein BcsQ
MPKNFAVFPAGAVKLASCRTRTGPVYQKHSRRGQGMSTTDLVQLVGVIGSVVVFLGGAIWWCLQRHLKKLHQQIRVLERKKERLDERLRKALQDIAALEGQRASLQAQVIQLEAVVKQRDVELAKAAWELDNVRGKTQKAQQELHTANANLDATRKQLKTAEEQSRGIKDQAKEENRRIKERADEVEEVLHRRIEEYQDAVETLKAQVDQLAKDLAHEHERAKRTQVQLTEEVTKKHTRAERAEARVSELEERIDQIKKDGRIWERPVPGPPPRQLTERDVPIISVLNLKGGVGKTTITANLAGTMTQAGKKVLVIDADYQRNLSMLLVPDRDRIALHTGQQTLQHFLDDKSHSSVSLRNRAREISELSKYFVVTNSDVRHPNAPVGTTGFKDISLEEVELRLMANWMLDRDGPDVRLFLREALHNVRSHDKEWGYDYVVIDCPPRLSTACINALAASDFVLVPVLLDATSARSVPLLLRMLGRLRRPDLFPDLKCLGIVANRVQFITGDPIKRMERVWKALPSVCAAAWEANVHLFRTMIPESGVFGEAAGAVAGAPTSKKAESGLALRDKVITGIFEQLFQEVEERIEHERKLTAPVPAQSANGTKGR